MEIMLLVAMVLTQCHVKDEEWADPLKARKNTEEVIKTLAAAYQQSEYAMAAQARITQILSDPVSFSIFQ